MKNAKSLVKSVVASVGTRSNVIYVIYSTQPTKLNTKYQKIMSRIYQLDSDEYLKGIIIILFMRIDSVPFVLKH